MASYPVVEAALMESVPDAVRGRVFGLFITFGGLFGNLSHWAVGALVKHLGPNASVAESYHPLYNFLAFMLLASMIGMPCLHAIRKREGVNGHVLGGAEPAALATSTSALK
jgi:MFS family permease